MFYIFKKKFKNKNLGDIDLIPIIKDGGGYFLIKSSNGMEYVSKYIKISPRNKKSINIQLSNDGINYTPIAS